MKKKRNQEPRPAQEGVKTAYLPPAGPRRGRKDARCVVCGSDAAPFSDEELCWICRRLKISAWRESDNQAAVQE